MCLDVNKKYNLRKHSVYPKSAGSHRPSEVHVLRTSPIKTNPSSHSNATVEPGTNKKFDLRPNLGVSRIPQDNTRLLKKYYKMFNK